MGVTVFFFRMKETQRPVTAKNIILPPIFMSTGALMFIFPMFRVTSLQVLEAVIVGVIFSLFLIKTSKFEVKDDQIFIKRSKAFIIILIVLLAIRLIAKWLMGDTIPLGTLSGMFFILAFAMIVPWRTVMYFQYKKVKETYAMNN